MGTSSFWSRITRGRFSGGEAVPVEWSVSEVAHSAVQRILTVALVLAAEVAVVARLPLSSVALSVSVEEL